jgi:hypothetical protein
MSTKKQPIAERPTTPNPYESYYSQNMLDVDKDIRSDIEKKGMECRWIDTKEFTASGNQHRHFWTPYKREVKPGTSETRATMDIKHGNDPEGFIRRKSLILAVRPKQLGDAHRQQIAARTERLHQSSRAQVAEMKRLARQAGSKVYEGFDDEDGN